MFRHPETAPPGSIVRVVAPSGPFEEDALARGLRHLADYDVRVPSDLMGRRRGFLAGDDAARTLELQAALDCSEARVIWLARGGYGLSRIAHHLDWREFRKHPKWIVGFSDGTVLHHDCAAAQISSLHGPNVTSLPENPDADVASLRAALQGDLPTSFPVSGWTTGRAAGPLVGGNLTVLCMLAAARRLNLPSGCLLMLEDVDETSYRVDRMLTALIVGGHLAEVAGFVLGGFTNCSPGRFGVPVEEVLASALSPLGRPMAGNFPSGHGAERRTWVHGARAELDADAGLLTMAGS